mmetsp:Transcript_22688/g.67118  ORF Transcript_22688/g.67118 Transcript_22688/m.67118 type:complete len:312 (-) Transcript_22688:172-1107(-)|eukprot:CAMPEP_0113564102 /NCGR_PEP_ID=MMETSP0015_2-20120614/21429_1 /TAXON_ID=2838 /ORGANISM="Odontella" /LENGTH=311 /DNA_ID=CAMNT_0000466139 /DNA_START=66 /DNA_END=1001 /DNA_ORIENTATION=+ /assembly_acc=CAM_ASM_000160
MIGFSLSPGGLLFPYHLGCLTALSQHGHISASTPLAGSSAGAIAVASHTAGVPPEVALDAATRVSGQCTPKFVARGGILPSLKAELDTLLSPDAHEVVNDREGMVGLAHRELFPRNRPVLRTKFETRGCLIDAVVDSSMFPYFTTNRPFRVVKEGSPTAAPRVTIDGVFTVPLHRFGCPDFRHADILERTPRKSHMTSHSSAALKDTSKMVPDRTVSISVIPHQLVGLTASEPKDKISPPIEGNFVAQVARLCRLGVLASTAKDVSQLFEAGWSDAERWVAKEDRRRMRKLRNRREKARAQDMLASFLRLE